MLVKKGLREEKKREDLGAREDSELVEDLVD
jgi:hypothetical protein